MIDIKQLVDPVWHREQILTTFVDADEQLLYMLVTKLSEAMGNDIGWTREMKQIRLVVAHEMLAAKANEDIARLTQVSPRGLLDEHRRWAKDYGRLSADTAWRHREVELAEREGDKDKAAASHNSEDIAENHAAFALIKTKRIERELLKRFEKEA